MTSSDPLAPFSEPTRAWFREAFAEPTRAQALGWPAIAAGEHTLLHAPTGSGKTLAAFLWCLDRLFTDAQPRPTERRLRVLYVSPLKALTYDVERNLRAPLAGIRRTAERAGHRRSPEVRVASRTGDTPADARRQLVSDPPDILVTTPESLYLLLTSQAREVAAGRRARDRRRDARHGRHQARRAPGALARAALGADRRRAAADRPVGHAAAAVGDRRLPGRRRAREVADRRRRRRQDASSSR